MHTKSWAELLKHFLCLFIFIDAAAAVVYIMTARHCMDNFLVNQILPIRLPVPHDPIEISVDLMFSIINSFGFISFLVAMYGLVGICTLSSREMINFTFGVLMAKNTFFDFTVAHAMTVLMQSYDKLIENSIVEVFDSTNRLNLNNPLGELDRKNKKNTSMSANDIFNKYNSNFTQHGWSSASEGGYVNQSHVDFIQLNLHCCGLTGREYWKMRIPRSCCSVKHQGEECVLSVAHSKNCLQEYYHFKGCAGSMRTELICFGIIALLTAMDSLYLAYLKVQFPDGDYKSDKSSDEEDQKEMANI